MISATRLFVGNLPENTEAYDLHSAFSVFGEVTNLDLKSKTGDGNESKKFAFVSLSAENKNIESCINHFCNEDFKGNKLYVTRARESFLERLQRERELAKKKGAVKNSKPVKKNISPIKLSEKLNPRKRKIELNHQIRSPTRDTKRHKDDTQNGDRVIYTIAEVDKKRHEADTKRQESMRKKRQEFKEKKMIIKTGLTGVDQAQNKKIRFSDLDDLPKIIGNDNKTKEQSFNKNLFDDEVDESDDEVNFKVKKQYEGEKGQKVLDLQSRYKSDKRFTLDERFIDEEEETNQAQSYNNEGWSEVDLGTADEKAKQMNILQDVLGVTIKQRYTETDSRKSKPNLGMLRFDPLQPDHAKFLAPVEAKPDLTKKSKKKTKEKQEDEMEVQPEPEGPKVEVSKEQFYKVSDALKEAIAQPSAFSLRSLFGNKENDETGPLEQEGDYIPLEAPKAKKVKNPLDLKEKNPFVYDSSDSETEETDSKPAITDQLLTPPTETKAVWKENLFFTKFDLRLKEGLTFFGKAVETEVHKDRRDLKSLMKKRIYNKDRKNQMFKKKIGGKKKSVKKPYKNKS